MTTTETFTELLRHPKEVAAATEHGAVRITRRDADDLILVRAGDLERTEEGIALASRLMRATLKHGAVDSAVRDLFSWVGLLSDAERGEFTQEVESLLWSAAELGEYRRLLDTFHSWRSTAQAYSAGLPRDGSDLNWLPDLPVVPRPA